MLTVLLLRHAKSSWDDAAIADHDRLLSDRGIAAAPLIAGQMVRHGWQPDLILCSTSVRTRATLDLVLPHLSCSPKVKFEDELYLADAQRLLDRIRRLPVSSSCAMLIGHNPGFEDLARMLSGGGDPTARAALDRKFPTAGLAVITFAVQAWSGIGPGRGQLAAFVTPRSLVADGRPMAAGSGADED